MLPEERKDTKPAARETDAVEVSPPGLEDGSELLAAADQLAAVTLADDGEAGPSTVRQKANKTAWTKSTTPCRTLTFGSLIRRLRIARCVSFRCL